MAGQRVSIGNIDFNVLYEGDKTKPVVVLVHALMSNLRMWDSTVVALHNAGFSTLRYDHVGHGKSSAPAADQVNSFHFDDFTHHIHKILEVVATGAKPFGMIGCSMGGVLVLRYAMLYPGTVSKIISCDAPGMTSLEASKQKWRDRIDWFQAEGVAPLARATVERWFPDPCPQEVKVESLQHTMACTLHGYECCAHGIMNYDYDSELDKIQSEEVIVLAGENDEAIGPKEILEDVASRVKGARYASMADTGHIPPMHSPQEFEKIVIDFLSDQS